MDPEDLALLNLWLAGANPQGGYLPLTSQNPLPPSNSQAQGLQGALGSPQPDVYWPDSWRPDTGSIAQQHADALEALYGGSGNDGSSQAGGDPPGQGVVQDSNVAQSADDLTAAQDPSSARNTAPIYAGTGAAQLSDGVYRDDDNAPTLTQVGYGSAPQPGAPTQSNLIGDSDRLYGDAARVASDLNSKWDSGNLDTSTAQRAFDQTNAAIDRTVAALESSNDPNAQAAIMRLNSIGAYMAKQAWQAGLQGTATQSQGRFMRDLGGDAGKDAMASAFGEEFGN